MFRFAFAILLLTATAAQAETYKDLRDFVIRTSKLGLDDKSTACYADAVVSVAGRLGLLTGGVKGDVAFNQKATDALEKDVIVRQWKAKKLNTLGELIRDACPGVSSSDARSVDSLHPLAELPNVSK